MYRQTRVGHDGQLFTLYKIRSMTADAEVTSGPVWAAAQRDPRVTQLGRFLRASHLDELPQLFNVLKGEMALVGPRPERPEFTEFLADAIPEYAKRLTVKPGITGLAQINLPPDIDLTSVRRKLVLDLEYITRSTPLLNAKILLCTGMKLLGCTGHTVARNLGLFDWPESADWAIPEPTSSTQVDSIPGDPQPVRELRAFSPFVRSDRPHAVAGPGSHTVTDRNVRPPIRHAFTVDVEDYYQVTAFEETISRSAWPQYESRVVASTHRILDLLDRHDTKGTFFVLGYVAQQHRALVQEIDARGHEIGSHSYWHRRVTHQTRNAFRDDLIRSRDLLSDLIGKPITAYRAPCFSITRESLWALDILAEEGFRIDSSIFPVRHDRYGIPDAPSTLHARETAAGPVWEFPPAVLSKFGVNLPVGGGGYFRLAPYRWTRQALQRQARHHNGPFIFYIHPWEVDPEQPRIPIRSHTSRFRHYVNLRSTFRKLDRLLSDFSFDRMDNVVAAVEASHLLDTRRWPASTSAHRPTFADHEPTALPCFQA